VLDSDSPTPSAQSVPENAAVFEGELIEPGTTIAPARSPGRRPMPPLHTIKPFTDEELALLPADPNELLRRRIGDYLTWAHNLISASPSRLNRCAFGVEAQRRMTDRLLSLAIPPARVAGDQFGDIRQSSDSELLAILQSLGEDPALSLRQAAETETGEDKS
jgi:hypothetical protein